MEPKMSKIGKKLAKLVTLDLAIEKLLGAAHPADNVLERHGHCGADLPSDLVQHAQLAWCVNSKKTICLIWPAI